jgi:hypothetical protein
MKKELLRQLRDFFDAFIKQTLPGISSRRPTAPFYRVSELVFGAVSDEGTEFVIIVSPHAGGHEAFTVEVGWSRKGALPRLSMRPSPGNPLDVSALDHDEYVTRLAYLDERVPEFWYLQELPIPPSDLSDLSLALAAKAEEALEATMSVGIPYLARAGLPMVAMSRQ